MEGIIWKDIDGFGGKFKINNKLEVYRVENDGNLTLKDITSDNCFVFSKKGSQRRKYRTHILYLKYFPEVYINYKIKELEEKTNTIWRSLKGFEENYLINEYGKIYKLDYDGFSEGSLKSNGYVRFSAKCVKTNKLKHCHVHRLVAMTFIPNPENKPDVNHIDGNRQNNHISNLEWCTKSENELHKYRVLNREMKGKPVRITNLITGEVNVYKTISEAERNILGKVTTGFNNALKKDRLYKKQYKVEIM